MIDVVVSRAWDSRKILVLIQEKEPQLLMGKELGSATPPIDPFFVKTKIVLNAMVDLQSSWIQSSQSAVKTQQEFNVKRNCSGARCWSVRKIAVQCCELFQVPFAKSCFCCHCDECCSLEGRDLIRSQAPKKIEKQKKVACASALRILLCWLNPWGDCISITLLLSHSIWSEYFTVIELQGVLTCREFLHVLRPATQKKEKNKKWMNDESKAMSLTTSWSFDSQLKKSLWQVHACKIAC